MGSIGAPELLLIALAVLVLFGGKRIADLGKGLGQGIKSFKQGLKDPDEDAPEASAKAEGTKKEAAEEA